MSNIKKIIAVVLALVMALSVATVAFAAEGDAYSVTVTADKTTLEAGESATVTVKVTANFNVSAMSIPVFFDNTKVTASAGATTLENATIVTETSPDVDKYFEGVDHTKDDYGVRAVVYIAPYGAEISSYTNATVMTFTVTANDGATGAVVLECISTSVKTSSNPSGALYIAKNSSGNATVDSLPEVIDKANITGAKATINIAGGAEPADLELTAAGTTAGVVIDKNKTFGGRYDGVVYGFPTAGKDNLDKTYYDNLLVATNEGSLAYTKSIFLSRGTTYGTGATITISNKDATVSKTYVIVIFGDVTGDGKVLAADASAVKKHQQSVTLITDDIQVMAINVVPATRGTTEVKAKALYDIAANDYSGIQKSIKGTALLDQGALAVAHAEFNLYYQ